MSETTIICGWARLLWRKKNDFNITAFLEIRLSDQFEFNFIIHLDLRFLQNGIVCFTKTTANTINFKNTIAGQSALKHWQH